MKTLDLSLTETIILKSEQTQYSIFMQKETFLVNFKSKESFSLTNLECSSCCQAVTVSDWLPGGDSGL